MARGFLFHTHTTQPTVTDDPTQSMAGFPVSECEKILRGVYYVLICRSAERLSILRVGGSIQPGVSYDRVLHA